MRIRISAQVLDRTEIERIHEASLDILERVGIRIGHPEVCAALRRAGAGVEESTQVVRLPRQLVMEAVDTAPKQIELHSPNGKVLLLSNDSQYWTSGGGMLRIVDGNGNVRAATTRDAADLSRLLDYSVVEHCGVPVYPTDVPESLKELVAWESYYLNCRKHVAIAPMSSETATMAIELCETVSEAYGLRAPCASLVAYATSPLQVDPDSAQVLIQAVTKGFPLMVASTPMAGGTGPLTLAGSIALANAEVLALIALSQTVREGAPLYYYINPSVVDLRKGSFSRGGPVYALAMCAGVQLARYYGLPCRGEGLQTDSRLIDMQAGLEMMLIGFPVMMGLFPDLTGGVGRLTARGLFSYELVVIHSELLQMLERFRKGIEVSAETLALDAIARVGHGGSFLDDDHTLKWMRSGEHFYPELYNREDQGEDMVARAQEKVSEILATYNPEVPGNVVEGIRRYGRRKRAELGST